MGADSGRETRIQELRLTKGAGRVFLNTVIDYYEGTSDGEIEADVGEYVVTVIVTPKQRGE